MKMRLRLAAALSGMLAVSLAGCAGSGEAVKQEPNSKLVVWTLSEDLKAFADRYTGLHPNMEIETVIIPPADYPTKLSAALRGKAATPDIIVGEPQMLPDFMKAGFFENLDQAPYHAGEYKDKLVDYVWELGKDEEGSLRALSYQATPGAVFYRRDIAKKVWGTDDPETIHEKFKDFAAIEETAGQLRDKGYRIFSDTGALRWFAVNTPWVEDGKAVISDEKLAYMDTAVNLYQNRQVAFAPEWSAAWYASMQGEIPLNAEWQELEDVEAGTEKTEVFCYVLPSWGALIIRDNAQDKSGSYGVCAGPGSFFGGGTFLGISSYSRNKVAAWDFVKYVTLNEETSRWWAEDSKGDIVSMISVLEEYKDKENPLYGNQKTYEFFYKEAQNIDASLITRYDDPLKNFWGPAIESVQKGEKTRDEAIKIYYGNVRSVYPELETGEQ